MSVINTIINIFINIIFASIIIYIQVLSFKKLSCNNKIGYNINNLIVILIGGVIVFLNTSLNTSILRLIISFITILIINLYLYKYTISKTFMNVLVTYIATLFYEILLSLVVVNFINSVDFDNSLILKNIFSLITILFVYLTCSNKHIIKAVNKYSKKLENAKFDIIFSSSILVLLMAIDVINFKASNIEVLIYNFAIVLCVICIIIYAVYNYVKAEKELNRIEILLSFMKKYERVIDKDRILRHEILNNLLVLNSIEDKNTDEYNVMLKDLIKTYSNDSEIKSKNIYKLPSGIKGLLYYKLYGLEEEGFKVNIKIAKVLPSILNKVKNKDYQALCKILNIVLDNAIESAKLSKNKIINIEIYSEKKNCVILVENSCDKKVNLSKIENKDYSTKGKRRGLGLYIVKDILKDNNKISLSREINNSIFSTKIIIK